LTITGKIIYYNCKFRTICKIIGFYLPGCYHALGIKKAPRGWVEMPVVKVTDKQTLKII
jgi:hypothetical protein